MQLPVVCKFLCYSVTKIVDYPPKERFIYQAEFCAVTDGSEENRAFFKATPWGTLKIGTYKEDVFQPGVEYLVTLSPAPAAVEAAKA